MFRGFKFDDGSSLELTGFAGGASPGGSFSTVTCQYTSKDGGVSIIDYVRTVPASVVPAELENWSRAMDRIVDAWNNLDPLDLIAVEYSSLCEAIHAGAALAAGQPEQTPQPGGPDQAVAGNGR